MLSPFRRWYAVVSCLIALASLTPGAQSQTTPNLVFTWHNDNNRTGRYLNENMLTPTPDQPGTVTQTSFGLLFQYPVQGQVYAQPLAVSNLHTTGCTNGCNVVFIATEDDWLYAFNVDSSSTTPLWSIDLASKVPPFAGQHASYVDCNTINPPCTSTGVIYPHVGVTGTPVISSTSITPGMPTPTSSTW
jgi:hypothetical protein